MDQGGLGLLITVRSVCQNPKRNESPKHHFSGNMVVFVCVCIHGVFFVVKSLPAMLSDQNSMSQSRFHGIQNVFGQVSLVSPTAKFLSFQACLWNPVVSHPEKLILLEDLCIYTSGRFIQGGHRVFRGIKFDANVASNF